MTTTTPSPAPVAVNDIGSTEEILAAVDETIKYFDDGDIVEGTVVKVDRDEVLLDIGYKTEGVILARELSIKHDVDRALSEQALSSRILLQIHDELLVEVAPGEAEAIEDLLKEQMERAAELSVPLNVAVGRGRTWREAAH